MTPDPAVFLSTIILASAALVAIVGGLLVARFVGLDSDQQSTRRVLIDADGRLRAARRRADEAQDSLLRWDAWDFLSHSDVLDAIARGDSDPAELRRLAETRLTEQELQPFVMRVAEEFARARGALADRVTVSDGRWRNFRKETPDLPEIRMPMVWEKVFEEIFEERAQEERAQRELARRRGFITPAMWGTEWLRSQPPVSAMPHGSTTSYEWQRRDDLAANYERAQQRVEDYQDELRRLQEAHAEIIRPDVRLWIGVAVLVIFAAVGVAWPLLVMSQGPADLAHVRWLVWPFAAALLILIIYVVVYLVTITQRRAPPVGATTGDDVITAPQNEPGNFGPDWTSRLISRIWPI